MKLSLATIIASSLSTTLAYPFMGLPGAPAHYVEESKRQLGFNAQAQAISTTGSNAFVPPGAGDLRGPCPGVCILYQGGFVRNKLIRYPLFISSLTRWRTTITFLTTDMLPWTKQLLQPTRSSEWELI